MTNQVMKDRTLADAPEYIRNFVNWSSIVMKKEYEDNLCTIIKNGEAYFRTHHKYIHFIMHSSTSTKVSGEIYKILKDYYRTEEHKKRAFDYVIRYVIIDADLVLTMLEHSLVIPDEKSVEALLMKRIKLEEKNFNEIIEIFILYGLSVNKQLVLKLLENKYQIICVEKYGIIIDEDIYLKCSAMNYYPYELQIIPTDKILHAELTKFNNLDKIKKFKEQGGKINTCCLEIASSVKNNFKVLKFLINELKIMPNDACIKNYVKQLANCDQVVFDFLLSNYTNIKNKIPEPKQKVKLDNKSTLIIDPFKILIDKTHEYKLKSKIRKFLNYKYNFIKYDDLYERMLKYFLSANLLIDNYFIINNSLSILLKLNECSILHIDQLDNILTYFILE
jgi:hypothetical protein